MAKSTITYDAAKVSAAFADIALAIDIAAYEGMDAAMKTAEKDAQETAAWREEGHYTVDYPSGEWSWQVTGLARSSITAYVVPNKKLTHFPDYWTTSHWNGIALQHPHKYDDSLTSSPSADPDKAIGIITMNVAYAPYLQDYEKSIANVPITVEVLEMNWVPVYIPIINGVMQRSMARVAAKYT